jgi:dTDP-4-amino-4,6-dideoxygalactose transaminase
MIMPLETALETNPKCAIAKRELFPFVDLQAQHFSIKGDVMEAVTKVLDSQHLILGQEVSSLEKEIGQLIGARFAIGCASGSDALLLALMAANVGSGDEVITTPFTFIATAGSIARLEALPVFVDIDPVTFNLDWRSVEAAITPRTKAIIPVHLFGLAAEMKKIVEVSRAHGVPVIEDAAQAIGARYEDQHLGNIGTFGCFSFFPSKNLGGAGDGGMVTTNTPELADRLSILRAHGSRRKYYYEVVGINSRLDALQATILRVKLNHLAQWTEARRRNAATLLCPVNRPARTTFTTSFPFAFSNAISCENTCVNAEYRAKSTILCHCTFNQRSPIWDIGKALSRRRSLQAGKFLRFRSSRKLRKNSKGL